MLYFSGFYHESFSDNRLINFDVLMQNNIHGHIYDWEMGRVSTNEPRHEISNNAVCATSKASDQPAHTRSLIRAFASRLNIL